MSGNMAAEVPTIEPTSLVAGDTLKFTKSLGDYPASDAWVLTYTLVNSANRYTFAATASGDDHAVTVAATTTASYAPGEYDLRGQVSKAGEVYTVATGQITVRPSFASATDGRSSAKKTLDAINAYLADTNNLAAASYEIAGRRLSRYTLADLLALRSAMETDVSREQAAQRIGAGLPDKRRVYVRFERPS
jgi:hypothetical protein